MSPAIWVRERRCRCVMARLIVRLPRRQRHHRPHSVSLTKNRPPKDPPREIPLAHAFWMQMRPSRRRRGDEDDLADHLFEPDSTEERYCVWCIRTTTIRRAAPRVPWQGNSVRRGAWENTVRTWQLGAGCQVSGQAKTLGEVTTGADRWVGCWELAVTKKPRKLRRGACGRRDDC